MATDQWMLHPDREAERRRVFLNASAKASAPLKVTYDHLSVLMTAFGMHFCTPCQFILHHFHEAKPLIVVIKKFFSRGPQIMRYRWKCLVKSKDVTLL